MSGRNKVLGGGGIHHVAMRVKDFDASERFYTEAMGFTPVARWGEGDRRAVMLDTGDGACLEIFAGGRGAAPEGAFLHVALNAADVDAAAERARSAGAEITVEPKTVDVDSKPQPMRIRLAFFKGPNGEVVELFKKL